LAQEVENEPQGTRRIASDAQQTSQRRNITATTYSNDSNTASNTAQEAPAMSGLSQAVRSIRNIWNHGDDDYQDEHDFSEEHDEPRRDNAHRDTPPRDTAQRDAAPRSQAVDNGYAPAPRPGYGGWWLARCAPLASGFGTFSVRSREKNIYTLRPKSQEDAAIAADALKTGDAVILNLEEVSRPIALRIIDFMSGVCYGLEGQGHAMKLGDLIFLYTPPEFEISSDETDYGENPDFFFKDVEPASQNASAQNASVSSARDSANRDAVRFAQAAQSQTIPAQPSAQVSPQPTVQGSPIPAQTAIPPQSFASGERRPWER
jgi:cell division inhibitor SepF